ncbi:MAG TPA: formate dehydrogenase accessory protein FdhE [Anaerolineae bacterium]|nr:formate dehydrogenase accessory protein FdhE [Anaerolineae bacterium]
MARPVTSTRADPQIGAALKRLDALIERAPDLAELAAFYRAVVPALHDAQAGVLPFVLDPETAQRKLESGLPLLVGEDLPLDLATTRELFLRLCRTVESAPQPERSRASIFSRGRPDPLKLIEPAHDGNGAALRSTAAGQIRRAVERNELDLAPVWEALAAGERQRMEAVAASCQLDAGLLRLLAENSLKPALRVWARALKAKVNLDHWRRGQCPMCGSAPALAEIQGKDGERRLRCGMCGADWYYPRLQCVFCSNSDHRTLGALNVEGEEEKYRAQTCEKCRGYLKIVATFDPTPVDQLAVEDLATLHLDLLAAERGYARPPVR